MLKLLLIILLTSLLTGAFVVGITLLIYYLIDLFTNKERKRKK